MWNGQAQTFLIPAGISFCTKENCTLIVIYTMYLPSTVTKVAANFGAD